MRRSVSHVALAAGQLPVLLVPAAGSLELVAHHEGAFDTPFESARAAAKLDYASVKLPRLIARYYQPRLERAREGAPDLLAVQSSAIASYFSYPSGQEVLPIGGSPGRSPPRPWRSFGPTWPLAGSLGAGPAEEPDPRIVWIARNCGALRSRSSLRSYFCKPSDATGGPTP